ncbi:MAG: RidA family protein [Rhizobacter sp.]
MSDIHYQSVLPEGWPRARGYSHGVVAQGTRQVRIAGQIGKAAGESAVNPGADFGVQWTHALANVVTVLRAAGGTAAHLVVLRVYVTDVAEFNQHGAAVGQSWSESIGKHFPAMTLVQVSKLLDPHAKVEIEAEAVLP